MVRLSDEEIGENTPRAFKRALQPRTAAAAVLCAALCVDTSAAQSSSIRKFHPPRALETYTQSINASGAISGYFDNGETDRAFIRSPDGGYTVYDILADTRGYGISDDGHITGTTGESGPLHGFVRDPAGVATMFDVPKATQTIGISVNDSGAVAGWYNNRHGKEIGFVRQPDGTLFPIDPPRAHATQALGINASGVAVGYYRRVGTAESGFVRAADGTLTSIQCRRSRITQAMAINDSGTVTGTCMDRHLIWHGFVRDAAGTLTVFDAPAGDTRPVSIAPDGSIAGWCFNGPAFVRKPTDEIVTFTVRNSVSTTPRGINSAGVIAGWFDQDGYVGFVRTP